MIVRFPSPSRSLRSPFEGKRLSSPFVPLRGSFREIARQCRWRWNCCQAFIVTPTSQKGIRKEHVHDIPNTNGEDVMILHCFFEVGVFYRAKIKRIGVMRSRSEKFLGSFSKKNHVEAGEERPRLSSFPSHKKGKGGSSRASPLSEERALRESPFPAGHHRFVRHICRIVTSCAVLTRGKK